MADPQPRDDSLNPNTWGAFEATDETGRVTSGELPPASDKPAPAPGGAPILDTFARSPTDDLVPGLSGIQATKLGEEDKLFSSIDRGMRADRQRIQQAYDAEGVGPDQLKPWNEEAERAKHMTKPLDAFGSLGSVFAIVASAFTHAPMKNALNGSAAAMNALRAGDEKEFTHAYESWKDNMKLVETRHRMQHEAYEDAIQLMTTDMTQGRSRMQMLAARFGDKKALFLLENGYDKELFDLQASRDKAVTGTVAASNAVTQDTLRQQVLETDPRWIAQTGNPAMQAIQKLEAFNRVYGVKQTPQQEIMGKYFYEHAQDNDGKGPTAEEAAKFWRGNLAPAGARGVSRFSGFIDQFVNQAGEASSPEEQTAVQDGSQPVPKSMTQSFEERFRQTYPDATEDDLATAKGELAKKLKGQLSIAGQKGIAAQELGSSDPAVRAHGAKRLQDINRALQETALPKNIPTIDKKTLASTPSLMDALQDLYTFADATGPIKGVPESLAAKYAGINDPAAVWAAAKAKADAALIEAQAGRMSVTGLKHLLETMPKNYQDARFNRLQIQSAMHQVADEAQTFLSAMEASGEKIPDSVMDKFTSLGIFPESQKARDPVYKLRTNPQSIPDGELMDLRKRNLSLSPQDMGLLKQELERRRKAWDEQTRTTTNPGGDQSVPARAQTSPQVPMPRPRPEQAAPGFLDQPDPNEPFDDTETDDEWVRRQDRDENTRMAPIEMDPKQGLTRDRNVFDEFTTPLQGQAPPGASIPPGRMSPQWQVSGRPDLAHMFPLQKTQYEQPNSMQEMQNEWRGPMPEQNKPQMAPDQRAGEEGEGTTNRSPYTGEALTPDMQNKMQRYDEADLMRDLLRSGTDTHQHDFDAWFGRGAAGQFNAMIREFQEKYKSIMKRKKLDPDAIIDEQIDQFRKKPRENPQPWQTPEALKKRQDQFDGRFGKGAFGELKGLIEKFRQEHQGEMGY